MRNERPKYDGWYNLETWRVSLWLEHDKDSDRYWREAAAQLKKGVDDNSLVWDDGYTVNEVSAMILAKKLKEEISLESPLHKPSMYADLLNAALLEVDWYEIAQHWLTE